MSSYHPLATVRVVNPATPQGFMIINESDLRDHHELWSDEPAPPADDSAGSHLRVGKGPRGKWYVWLEREKIEGPFDVEADAVAALTGKSGG